MLTGASEMHELTGRNPLQCKGNSAASNTIKLVQWPLMGGLLHLVQRRGN